MSAANCATSAAIWADVMFEMPGAIDTVAAYTQVPYYLSDDLFQGGIVQEEFDRVGVSARLWHNPASKGDYEPRVTYMRDHGRRDDGLVRELGAVERVDFPPGLDLKKHLFPYGMLKIEFSLPKLARLSPTTNPTMVDVELALERATVFVRGLFGEGIEPVSQWVAQRVDYTWMWDVDPYMKAYMSVLKKLRVAGMSRHPFADQGVVWKSKGRWVKFYDKSQEAGVAGQVLRFEVSNYKPAVRYIRSGWFACDGTVEALVQPEVALFVMSYVWEKLGLGRSDHYGHEELMVHRLRGQYGSSVAAAYYALMIVREYGVDAVDEGLISKNNYYQWRRKLRDDGFLTEVDASYVVHDVHLPALHLPTEAVFDSFAKDLGEPGFLGVVSGSKKIWQKLWSEFGLKKPGRINEYLCERWKAYVAS